MMKHVLVIALLAVPLVALAGPKQRHSKKQKSEAQVHIDKATDAHQAGDFETALVELQAAYALDPQPDLLYAMGQVHVKLGECEQAIDSYEQFLATNPDPDIATQAQQAIDTCKAQLPPPTPEPAPAPAVQPPPPPPPAPEARPFYTDKIGDALVGGGVIALVIGGVEYASARGTLDDADAATTYAEHQELVDDAHGKRNIGVAFGVIGVAAIGVGIWHYTKYHSEQAIAVTPTTSGGMVTWMGQF